MIKTFMAAILLCTMCRGAGSAEYVRPEGETLGKLARMRGKHFGANFSIPFWGWGWQGKLEQGRTSIYARDAEGDRAGYEALAKDHFTILVGGCDTFFIQNSAASGVYEFESANALVQWLQHNNIAFHYHGLGYMQRNKFNQWAEGKSSEDIRQRYEDYVRRVATNFKGKTLIFDVVNEHANYGAAFRGTPGYNKFLCLEPFHRDDEGEVYALDYYLRTLAIAHEIDPQARYVYLDFNNEIVGSKMNVMYRTAKSLLDNEAPLHAIGFQLHTSTNFNRSRLRDGGKTVVKHTLSDEAFIDSMRENCRRIGDLGLDVWSTEVSVMPAWEHVDDRELSLQKQAFVYRKLIEVCLEFSHYRGFKLWGIGGVEGLMKKEKGGIGAYLFDQALKPKPCFYAIRDAFANYHPKVIASLNYDDDRPTGFTDEPHLDGAAETKTVAYNGTKSLLFAKAGDQLLLRINLSGKYNSHLSYRWLLQDLPYDRPFSETLEDTRFDRDMLVIEVSSDGSTWQQVRTYNRQELVYRLVEISPWHAGSTTLVGMDGKQDVHIRFRALEGMNGHEFLLDAIEIIADDASDGPSEAANLPRGRG
jgi:endo-1,4-beta-xylanase